MTTAQFNDNQLRVGVFGLNVSNGCAANTADGPRARSYAVPWNRKPSTMPAPISSTKATGTRSPTWLAANAGLDRRALASVCAAPAGVDTS
jgi:hypothetical protein